MSGELQHSTHSSNVKFIGSLNKSHVTISNKVTLSTLINGPTEGVALLDTQNVIATRWTSTYKKQCETTLLPLKGIFSN